jgi:diadenosine tetraphosphate (Ap4A) HIT family hydrolase
MNKFISLRKAKTEIAYRKHQKSPKFPTCYICTAKAQKTYEGWRIIRNEYPYDEIATRNDMLVPLRHTTENDLTEKELREFTKIKEDVNDKYDMIIENTHKRKSIPGHFHLHLIQLREKEMKE